MTYSARVDREHPTLVMLLLDQSGSMEDRLAGDARTKSRALADTVDRLLYELVLRCVKSTSEGPRHYYDIGLIAYGPGGGARSGWSGALHGRTLVSSVEVANNPLRVEDRPTGDGEVVRVPIWFEPHAEGATPMCAAMDLAGATVADWIRQHPASFPPVVIHVTDGESTDGDPSVWADRLRSLSTNDGNVLLFNLSLSDRGTAATLFPSSPDSLPTADARNLFAMSSELPPFMVEVAASLGYPMSSGARGFVHNADIAAVANFFQIGTATRHALPA